MHWTNLEKSFIHAWELSFSKAKFILGFICLSLCGMLAVFCRILSVGNNSWVNVSLRFMPILLSLGLLLSLGVVLARIYRMEMRGFKLDLKKIAADALEIAMETSYLSLPPVFAFVCLWIVLGLFILLKQIPLIGLLFSVFFAFGPILLVLCSLLLCLGGLFALFFVVPALAYHSKKRLELWTEVWKTVKTRPFEAAILFILAIIPVCLMGGLLALSASIANQCELVHGSSVSISLGWFFAILPFGALLVFPIIFFFNFAAESYRLLRR